MNPMTDTERRFATEHHDVVARYLRWRQLDPGEYYDVVILRYMAAVQQYLTQPRLRQYKFETIARNAMRSALSNHFRSEQLRLSRCVTNTELVERAPRRLLVV